MPQTYPSLLKPVISETITVAGQAIQIPKAELLLRQWTGAAIADDFGRKPLIDMAGQPMFAELVVCELFKLSGWNARWIETFGAPALHPSYYTGWQPRAARATQVHHPIADDSLNDLLQKVAVANGHSFAGCWDVLGWHGTSLLFAELKRRKKDRLQATQPRWLAAGLQIGLQPANFLLVEWDFMPDS